MKAIVFSTYGTPEDLELKEVEKPTPRDNEILVKIHASSINDWDWALLRGKPFVNRLAFGLFKPKKLKTLGIDISGTVESLGKNVTKFRVGDEVFGDLSNRGFGGFAEYVCVEEMGLELKPSKMTFEEAAAIPQAGVLAIQGLIDKINIRPGHHVLINGAGGGSGTFAIQLAKHLGATVTGVDKASKFDTMRSLGADHVIDYTTEDFTQNGEVYDLILDFAGHHPLLDYKRALNKKGKYILVGGATSLIINCLLLGTFISFLGSKKFKILAHEPNKHLSKISALYEAGTLRPIIDRILPLRQVPQALHYFGEGLCNGKIIISMANDAV
ncbi:MAG: NADPH:quinone reductase-like Zn-dependent oxidoreductase [Psychroserpens sp.]|jgi:NADPH:quinone reductase-like Zn-dependent oxidoreductase